MSEFFENVGQNSNQQFIPPDYSGSEADSGGPKEDDDDEEVDFDMDLNDEDDIEEEEDDVDEGRIETILDEQNKNNERLMQATPFGTPSSTPSWGSQGGTTWGSNGNTGTSFWGSNNGSQGSVWGKPPGSGGFWGSNVGTGTQGVAGKTQLDRTKRIIFIDFLDAVVETYQSNSIPGLSPRDIYDVKPRFDVWQKLAAFNPEKVYTIIPKNLLKDSTGLPEGLNIMMSYYCCSLAAFLRLPYDRCQVLVQEYIGFGRENIIRSVMSKFPVKIRPEDVVLVGINSGLYGQSNSDLVAANNCGITYYDLNQLLSNMY